jgi:hypothetical protein
MMYTALAAKDGDPYVFYSWLTAFFVVGGGGDAGI